MTSQGKINAAFKDAQAAALSKLAELKQLVESYEKDLEQGNWTNKDINLKPVLHWGHVGDMKNAEVKLNELVEMFNGTAE